MKFQTVKNDSELKLNGITFDVLRVNGIIKNLTMKDSDNNIVQIMVNNYDVAVCVPEPPTMVTKYRVHGTVVGVPVDHLFDTDYDARNSIEAYKNRVYDASVDVDLYIEKVEVPEVN